MSTPAASTRFPDFSVKIYIDTLSGVFPLIAMFVITDLLSDYDCCGLLC